MAAALAREGSEMAATSSAFMGGETAGALFVPCKTANGCAHHWGVRDFQKVAGLKVGRVFN